ncbi:GNAT family N-acetyltransferase [Paucilactobacillus suebicus]|uniref:Acetyltransferase n=1 Tax=Paucilactobacillus suebicus DSM 5007 = KCTC 3549 TaxID=1423807 RepID=A0A0R1W6U6_9LACO|nr:GNAT family N-acetyltransferase [Paucilactobacillus suebicus]KRM13566.1 acetyltransferase [Paucilactobacillus suebicus DSM 5007 = KCTC 3549]
MSDEVNFDIANKKDAAKVLGLLRALQVESTTFTISPEFATLTVDDEADNIDKISQTDDNLILLAWLDGEPIGIVTVSRVPGSPLGELGLAVRKAYWHQGLGTALVDEALNWGWGCNYSSLIGLKLDVMIDNIHAIQLYQKMGFKEIETHTVSKDHRQVEVQNMEIMF